MRPSTTLRSSLILVILLAVDGGHPAAAAGQEAPSGFEVAEVSILDLQRALETGEVTSVQLVEAYLARIQAFDLSGPRLNAMVRVNPDALSDAEALDRERRERRARGALHGIPVLLKDNFDVAGVPTSAGSLALAGLVAPSDAHQVRRLREAGAVLLGRTNMHELASGITTVGSLVGQTLNPYDPRRNPGGSSGGTGAAVAASYAAVGWGSDTCGSIRIPASHANLFGLRATKGLSSITGILPLSLTQDVAGPLARTATDLAIALDATVGADADDPATRILEGRALPGFVEALDAGALVGVRLGVLESYFGQATEDRAAGSVVREAIERMEEAGAVLISVEIPGLDSLIQDSGLINHEFKWDLMDYLASVPNTPVETLSEILELGLIHDALVATMRQRNAPEARETDVYRAALARQASLRKAVVATLERERLDALVYPTMRRPPAHLGESQLGSNCSLSANTGLPALSVPAGFTTDGLPIGMDLLGRPLEDARLLAFGYSFEKTVEPRRAPPSTPPLAGGRAPDPLRFTVLAAPEEGDGSGVRAEAHLTWNGVSGTLDYEVSVTGVAAGEIHAVVLRWSEGERDEPLPPSRVVKVLSGPERLQARGSWVPRMDFRAALERSDLHMEVFTRDYPTGAARGRILLPTSN